VITRTFARHRVCLMIQSASSRAAAAYGWPTRAAVFGSAPWVRSRSTTVTIGIPARRAAAACSSK
jgi:hypothetical protein